MAALRASHPPLVVVLPVARGRVPVVRAPGPASGPGVGARCGNGLFSTYKSPKFYLSFTILVSLILVKYPDRIGPVNTVLAGTVVPTVRYRIHRIVRGFN